MVSNHNEKKLVRKKQFFNPLFTLQTRNNYLQDFANKTILT